MTKSPGRGRPGFEGNANQKVGAGHTYRVPSDSARLTQQQFSCAPLVVELTDDAATVAGATVYGSSALVTLCRMLIAAAHDPVRPLHVYSGVWLPIKISQCATRAA